MFFISPFLRKLQVSRETHQNKNALDEHKQTRVTQRSSASLRTFAASINPLIRSLETVKFEPVSEM